VITDRQEIFVPSDTPASPAEEQSGDAAKPEGRFARAAEEVEVAAWETVYEVEDLARDAVEKVKHLGHHQDKP
jgi:hypothetical protein